MKREIGTHKKAMGLRWVGEDAPSQDGSIDVFSLEQKKKREAGVSIRHSYIDSSLISGVP